MNTSLALSSPRRFIRSSNAVPATVRVMLLSSISILLLHGIAPAQEAGRYEHYEVYESDLFPLSEYAARRAEALRRLGPRHAMLVRSADPRNRSNDVDYEFRQRNNLLYLTGVTERESALLLVPAGVEVNGSNVREILFVAERNPSHEVWTGVRMGPKVASRVTGVPTVLPYSSLGDVVGRVIASVDTLYYDDWMLDREVEPLTGDLIEWRKIGRDSLAVAAPGLTVLHAGKIVHAMRAVKSEAEIAMMRKAVDITIEAHRETMRRAKPGMHEYEFEGVMEYTFHRLGAEEPGYPSIVGSGPNTCILHYETNRRRSLAGDLVLMDCGAEYHGYSADITRTFPVSGRFTPEQRAIYDLVLAAQTAGIEECKPGAHFSTPHKKATGVLARGLAQLGIIANEDEVGRYFMHGTSHFLGMDVHDVSNRWTLEPGMVLTVEPGIYIAEGSPCDPKWWNIGIRIEDDILVTPNGPVNMSAKLERTAEEIERLVGMMNYE